MRPKSTDVRRACFTLCHINQLCFYFLVDRVATVSMVSVIAGPLPGLVNSPCFLPTVPFERLPFLSWETLLNQGKHNKIRCRKPDISEPANNQYCCGGFRPQPIVLVGPGFSFVFPPFPLNLALWLLAVYVFESFVPVVRPLHALLSVQAVRMYLELWSLISRRHVTKNGRLKTLTLSIRLFFLWLTLLPFSLPL